MNFETYSDFVGKLSQLVEALIDSQTLKKRCALVVHAEIQ